MRLARRTGPTIFPRSSRRAPATPSLPWLITFTGRTVESPDQAGRFQFDFTRTIAELWDSNYYGYFADLLHQHGLKAQVEAYGNGTFDTVRSSGLADMSMSEYWYPSQGDTRAWRSRWPPPPMSTAIRARRR